MTRLESFTWGVILAFFILSAYVIIDTVMNLPEPEERICRSETGHKKVPCP